MESAFDGEGARLYGGRWNSVGTPIVYAAESRSLAILEMLVHLDFSAILNAYVLIPIELAEPLIGEIDTGLLPVDWNAKSSSLQTKNFGDEWFAKGESAVLRVPSVLAPGEFNYLLNPKHPRFREIKIGIPTEHTFDERLFR